MKFQAIFAFMIASLAAASYAQPCTITLKGQFTHTFSGQSGCYGADSTDPISVINAPNDVTYELYNDYNCNGLVFIGSGVNTFNYPVQARSVKLMCPSW
ncbi:513_t:CDS:2 [Paraglomus occultum]|uniref:513_t:CDS:1 n=1 Tax=Paraglomus occultum TaxID=144539 RepID=A0A9N9CMF1_9GLOM|nr:513_t:CDS:2 [Paraglomus occultum]